MFGVEDRVRNVVKVTSARVYLPRLGLAHSPDFDYPIVRGRNYQRESWVEYGKIDTAIVPLKNVFDGRKGIERFEIARSSVWCAFSETRDIPHSDGLIHGGRNDEVFFWVELR